jgi:hypothetical protein
MKKEQFEKYYKKELNDFRNSAIEDKNNIQNDIREKLKSLGYEDILKIREEEISSDIKKNSMNDD